MRGVRALLVAMASLLLAVAAAPRVQGTALAQSGGPYGLTWGTIDGGGATFSTGGEYTLGGTIGQPDAGLMAGGDFTLGGGFWGGGGLALEEPRHVFLPLVLRTSGSP